MTPLTQQLEDKKKGCAKGKELLKQRLEDKDNKYIADFIKENWKKELVCCQNNLCPSCKSNIAILEQAIAEIKKQRQEIIEDIKTLGRNNKAYYSMIDGKNHIDICIEDVEQLNQPKEEKDGS